MSTSQATTASRAFTRWKTQTTAGAPMFPLGVLFGLNMVVELDRTAFGVLLPEIRDHFALDTGGILALYSLATTVALLVAVPIGYYADRLRRVRIAAVGASVWGCFSMLTGLAGNVWMLGVARAGAGLDRAVNEPVHPSLLSDYYDVSTRARVYGVYKYSEAAGRFIGPLLAGFLGFYFGWRAPFIVIAVLTATFVVLALRLREPLRGRFERRAAGAAEEIVEVEEASPSWAESWRILWHVRTMRRFYLSVPFLAIALIGLGQLANLYYDEIFGLDERGRGFVGAGIDGAAPLLALILGIPVASKLMSRDPGLVFKFNALVAVVLSVFWVLFALAPSLPTALAAHAVLSAGTFLLVPGVYAVMSQVMPSNVRAFGFAVLWLWVIPGLLLLPVIGALADAHGLRIGLLAVVPVFLTYGWIAGSSGAFVARDIDYVWRSSAARSEVALLRRQGKVKQVLARGIDVHYDGVQVLFGVDLEVDEGEIVALLGTNGAGKSTLLRAMSGLVQPSGGAVVVDGRDMTHTPPDEVASRGIALMPGGQGVFTQLTVSDNLRLAGWQQRREPGHVRAAADQVLDIFPELAERWEEPAGNLSGGQQQMLALGMAFVANPRLLMIDELSLGLAPAVVGRLLELVRALNAQGTTIILVEQSVNVALTVAERAYFMEKGEIRFEGPTAELLERPDLLRSVFFGDRSKGNGHQCPEAEVAPAPLASADPGFVPVGGDTVAPAVPAAPVLAQPSSLPDERSDVAPAAAPVLEVRGVSRSFGGVQALDDVSFDVQPDEILGFVGPNGAGKTTLFDVISGFTPGTGTVRLRTGEHVHDLHRLATHKRAWHGLGRSFQDGRLFGGLSVTEAIAVALEQHVDVRDPVAACLRLPVVGDSEQKVRSRVDDLVELLGLGAYRNKFVRELSTGTRRVVDLACVLAQGATVVLLDEPSSGIAQSEAEALGPVLQRVRRELGASLLVIEHDLPLLRSIADRALALDQGRVVTEGQPDEVLNHPRVVASYLGSDTGAIHRSGAPTPVDVVPPQGG